MSAHVLPEASQRLHWYSKWIGGVPRQAPGSALMLCPSVAVPDSVGGEVFAGGASVTTAVGAESADAMPSPFVAETWTRNVKPMSAGATEYDASVASGTSSHCPPSASQRRHWYARLTGTVPAQTPGSAVSVSPSWVWPVTLGSVLLAGAAASTSTVGSEVAVAPPASFVAVTSTSIR